MKYNGDGLDPDSVGITFPYVSFIIIIIYFKLRVRPERFNIWREFQVSLVSCRYQSCKVAQRSTFNL